MSHTSQRTQIYLPKKLRAEIDAARALTGQSLAEFLRESAKFKIEHMQLSQKSINEEIAEMIDSLDPKKSGWYGIDPVKWQRKMRKEEDEHIFGKQK